MTVSQLITVSHFQWLQVIVLFLFLPLTALTYYFFRRHRRKLEVKRICEILKIDPAYEQVYNYEKPSYHFIWAVAYASVVSLIGLTVLFLGSKIGFAEFPSVAFGENIHFPQQGSRLVFGMAFLGAYLWGLQYVFRRYSLNDLVPGVYYSLSLKMILSALIALVSYNAFLALAGGEDSGDGITSNIWPILGFLMGMFPQRGLRWLMERLPFFSPEEEPSVQRTPLKMIEGIESHDRLRLEEEGIDTCYDLATADFVPLILNTPYSGRQLIDWILQAKLCVYFGEAVKDLRQQGIRTIISLESLTEDDIEALARESTLNKSALERAQKSIKNDPEIKRLCKVGLLLGEFSDIGAFSSSNAHSLNSPRPPVSPSPHQS
ncbi:MAG: hypothetical protein AB4426_05460 [Xenococcaceae cyanobacterium]